MAEESALSRMVARCPGFRLQSVTWTAASPSCFEYHNASEQCRLLRVSYAPPTPSRSAPRNPADAPPHSSGSVGCNVGVAVSGSKSASGRKASLSWTSGRRTSICARRSKTSRSAAMSGGWVIDRGQSR